MWGYNCGVIVCVYNNSVWWGCPRDQSRGHPQAPLRVAIQNLYLLYFLRRFNTKLYKEGKGIFIKVVILNSNKYKKDIVINGKTQNLIFLKYIITRRLKVKNNLFKVLELYYI